MAIEFPNIRQKTHLDGIIFFEENALSAAAL